MGAWGTSITGNDTAQDLRTEYQAAFFYYDVETALEKIYAYVRAEGINEADEEEWCNYYYSLTDFMFKKGILTDCVKEKALQMIDSGFGLEVWEESGVTVLEKRKKVLAEFKDKICSPQPPKKKIRINLFMKPIFNVGDVVAIRLKTADKTYLVKDSRFDEAFFRNCHDKWVALRKLEDIVSYSSAIVPEVKDIWPQFQLYGKIFDECPTLEQLEDVPWAKCFHGAKYGIYECEGSMVYFKRRDCQVLGNSVKGVDLAMGNGNLNERFSFGFNTAHYNADTIIINAIV